MTTTPSYFIGLNGHEFANLITYRKNGAAISTPVWFAEKGGKLYIMTVMDSGKVKRIRNSGRVAIEPATRSGKPLGAAVTASARILSPSEDRVAREALDAKYGLMKAAFDFFLTLRGTERAWIEVAPGE